MFSRRLLILTLLLIVALIVWYSSIHLRPAYERLRSDSGAATGLLIAVGLVIGCIGVVVIARRREGP